MIGQRIPNALMMLSALALTAASVGVTVSQASPRRCHVRAHHRCLRPAKGRPPNPPAGQPAPDPVPLSSPSVQVREREFSIALSRQQVPPGWITFEQANRGEDPHDLRIVPEDGSGVEAAFSILAPGSLATQRLNLPAGRYRLWCSLPGHAELGMKAELEVK